MNWFTGRPDDAVGAANCVNLMPNLFWDDMPCSKTNPYVCERPLGKLRNGYH